MSQLATQGTRRHGEKEVEANSIPQQYLTFALGSEVFALGILAIKEIMEYTPPCAVPMMPDHVRGVINLRGTVVPVLDLMVRFGRTAGELTKRTCIVIIETVSGGKRQDVGVVVDAVDSVLDIPTNRIEPPPSFGTSIAPDFIAGMSTVNGKFVILLNLDSILAADAAKMMAEAA